jgi:hypothetical protein
MSVKRKSLSRTVVEGLEIPRKLEFGNDAHIMLRNRIAKRKAIIENGVICPCGESRITPVKVTTNKLIWQCGCGWSGTTGRDVGDYLDDDSDVTEAAL